MRTPTVTTVQGELIGETDNRLKSAHISDFEPVFTGPWFNDLPRPRFGDATWEVSGSDPSRTHTTRTIEFDDLPAEWSLITREMLYWRANLRKIRHIIPVSGTNRYNDFRTGTIVKWRSGLASLADISDKLEIGTPATWTIRDTDELRAHIVDECPNIHLGNLVQALHRFRDVLTLGGLNHDPTRDYRTARQWAGDTARSRERKTQAIPPHVFRQIVGNALTYIEQCAPDILAAHQWKKAHLELPRRKPIGNQLRRDHPVRLEHPDVTTHRQLQLHNALERIGGIPTATVSRQGRDAYSLGEHRDICLATLYTSAGLGLRSSKKLDHGFLLGRLDAGVPKVPGGLPIPVSDIRRTDGTTGRWRDPWCWQSIAVEEESLHHACHIVIAAFTAMRDSEMARIPVHGWRTTWMASEAITAPLVKNAYGESMKWWATPPVTLACEILQQIAPDDAEFLLTSKGRADAGPVSERTMVNTGSHPTMQVFVWRMNTDHHLHGFLEIDAGWRKTGQRRMSVNHSKPSINARQFRFTLASISNFVALGDAAFQQQAKHAKISMSHSYAANAGSDQWTKTILNTMANDDAHHRTAETVDMFIGVWTGHSHLAGHAGRELTRTVRDLLDSLPIQPFDEDSENAEVDQFMTQVLSNPELAAAIKSTAQILYPGTVAHCLRYVQQMECTDKTEPAQGLCHPQTCRNVLLDPAQQQLFEERLERTEEWLAMPRIPPPQRAVLQDAARHLRAQLHTEGT